MNNIWSDWGHLFLSKDQKLLHGTIKNNSRYDTLIRGFLTFCHPYGWHSFICHICARPYIFAIANSNPPTFLSFLLRWHARWACQRGREPGSPNLAREMTTLPSPPSSVSSLPSPESNPVHSPFFPTHGNGDGGCGGRGGGGIESPSPSLDVGQPYLVLPALP